MTEIISTSDLPTDVAAQAMSDTWVDGANARASRVAPCLAESPTDDQLAEARLVLIGAVIRWSQAGAGAFQSLTAGPFVGAMDTRQRVGFNLWPSEITQLQDICRNGAESAFSVDTVSTAGEHSPICSIYFGGEDCSCGADIAGLAIYEQQ